MWSEVWGNAAEWTGAILTGGALFVAALVYRHDSKLSRSAQAKLVRPRILGSLSGDAVRVLVENYSEASIFRVTVEVRRTGLYRAFLLDSADSVLDPDQRKRKVRDLVRPTYEKYRRVKRHIVYYDDGAERLQGADVLEYRVERNSPFQQVYVTFLDSNGQKWEVGDLATQRQELRKVKPTAEVSKPFRYPKARLFRPFRAVRELTRLLIARCVASVYEIRTVVTEKVVEEFKTLWNDRNYEQQLRDTVRQAISRQFDQLKTDAARRRADTVAERPDPAEIEPTRRDRPRESEDL